MFEAYLTTDKGEHFDYEVVEQMIAPQGAMTFWTIMLPANDEGVRETQFFNQNFVRTVFIRGTDEEHDMEQSPEGNVVQLRAVDDELSPEGA